MRFFFTLMIDSIGEVSDDRSPSTSNFDTPNSGGDAKVNKLFDFANRIWY